MAGISETRRLKRAIIGVVLTAVLGLFWSEVRFFAGLENLSQDLRFKTFNPQKNATSEVVVIDIDDPSIKFMNQHYGYGRWPLPRIFYKDLLEFLRQCGVKSVYFDVLFTEKQNSGDDDKLFAEILKTMPETSMALFFDKDASIDLEKGKSAVAMPAWIQERAHLEVAGASGIKRSAFDEDFKDFLSPQEPLLSATRHFHVVNTSIEWDGKFRREPLVVNYDRVNYASLSLAALQNYYSTEKSPVEIAYRNQHIEIRHKLDGQVIRSIPVGRDGMMDINFYTRDREPKSIPVAPIIQTAEMIRRGDVEDPSKLPVQLEEFKDKIVLIGTSAIGASDLKWTPVDAAQPGVLLHADAISNVINGDFIRRPRGWMLKLLEFILSVGLGSLTYFSVFRLKKSLWQISVPLLGLASVLLVSLMGFKFFSVVLPFVLPSAVVFLALVDSFSHMTFVEGRERKRMQENLSKYLPPAVIEEMIATGKDLQAEVGKKEKLSILFSDIRGFTTLSERLSPELVVSILNEYLDAMTRVIFANGGTLDKFIGDAIMAFWGAPIPRSTHAIESVRGALAMIEALKRLQKGWESNPIFREIKLEVGLGINTGEVVVGNIGGEKKLDYTVIGDNVNLASRLEGLTKQYGVTLIVSESTYNEIKSEVVCRVVDRVQVKGKLNAVNIYEPLAIAGDEKSAAAREFAESFEKSYRAYCEGNFQKALAGFEIHQKTHDKLSDLYVERCKQFLIEGAPANWDGTYVAKTK